LYKKGGQKKNVKCLCKNGQNGDPAWKKSCSWSFQDARWSVSDVKSVQCKASTNQSTTTTTTITTTTTTQANPNTHRICKIRNTWMPCSNCYAYVETDHLFYNYKTFEYEMEEHTCTYSISTACNPNFVDKLGRTCDKLARGCQKGGYRWYIDQGFLTDSGFMTALNCPQCGCTEENGPIRANFATLTP